jgi:hypothetical protein
MINIKKERRHRKAVELICQKLEITDAELDLFIGKKQGAVNAAPEYEVNVKGTLLLIKKCTKAEELEQFKSDERKTVIAAVDKRLQELG